MKINYQSDFKIIEKSLNGDVNTPFRFTYFNPFKGKFIAPLTGMSMSVAAAWKTATCLSLSTIPVFLPVC